MSLWPSSPESVRRVGERLVISQIAVLARLVTVNELACISNLSIARSVALLRRTLIWKWSSTIVPHSYAASNKAWGLTIVHRTLIHLTEYRH